MSASCGRRACGVQSKQNTRGQSCWLQLLCKDARRTLEEAAASTVHVLTAVAGDARVDASTVRHLVTALAAMEDNGFAQDVLYDDALRAAVGVASSRCASPKTAATALDFVARLALRSADDALAAGAAEAAVAVVACQIKTTTTRSRGRPPRSRAWRRSAPRRN